MRKIWFPVCMLALIITCMAGMATAAPTISFEPATVSLATGETAQVVLTLNEAPDGLNGYQFDIIFPPAVARVSSATFPSWAILNQKTPGASSFRLSAIDLNKQVQSGLTNIPLATLTVTGIGSGTASLSISNLQIDSDADSQFTPALGTLQVTVSGSGTTTTTTTTTATTTTGITTSATTAVTTEATTAPIVTATMGVMPGAPVAGFTALPSTGNAPLKVQFYDRSTNTPTTYEWDFGDGGTSMIQNPSYTYYSEGLYTVKLKATNNKGSTSVTQKEYIAVGEKYIRMQPTAAPLLTIAGADLPAPTTERTPAATTPGLTQKPATSPGKAAAGISTPLAGLLVLAALWALVTRK